MNIHLIIDCNHRFQTKSCMQNIILYIPLLIAILILPVILISHLCIPFSLFLLIPYQTFFIYILFISEIKVHKIHFTRLFDLFISIFHLLWLVREIIRVLQTIYILWIMVHLWHIHIRIFLHFTISIEFYYFKVSIQWI